MKKKVFCLLSILLLPLCLAFVGCSKTSDDVLNGSEGQNPSEQVKFVDVGYYEYNGYYYAVIVNKATKVMYIHYGKSGQMTVMLNPDGTPMIYQGELD